LFCKAFSSVAVLVNIDPVASSFLEVKLAQITQLIQNYTLLSQGCNGSCASHSGLTALAAAIQ
jgi:hypothetical protein